MLRFEPIDDGDGKLSPLYLPRADLFEKKFPSVFFGTLKQRSLDTQFEFEETTTGDVYAYNNVDGWKKIVTFEFDDEENTAPSELQNLFPSVTFTETIPGVQYKDINENVYGKFEHEGWEIIPATR
jgi:hypothetical protein